MENMKEVNNELLGVINDWRNQNNSESFRKVVEQIKNASFYCPVKTEQDGTKMIAITKNAKGDSLLYAFTSKEEAEKWNNDSTIGYEVHNFEQYANFLLMETNKNLGFVIDPYGVNLALDKNIINDIKNNK